MTIKIKSGIYQGDLLSPLVFCLALAPLSSLLNKSNIALDVNTIIQDLEQDGTYKYTGVSEGDGGRGIPVQHSQIKEKTRKKYYRSYRMIRMVFKSEVNSANKLEAINTSALPVVTYSFNTINWTLQELAKLDRKARKFLTMYKMHHPKSEVDSLYLPRTKGGRGSYNCSFPTSQPLSVLIITSRRCRTPSSTLSKTIAIGNPCTPSADSQ